VKKKNGNADEVVVLENAPIITFLALHGCSCVPFVEKNGRVSFRVSGPVTPLLTELQKNPSVKILDFIHHLSIIRSLIFQLRGQHRDG
jgi:hypothetical protein